MFSVTIMQLYRVHNTICRYVWHFRETIVIFRSQVIASLHDLNSNEFTLAMRNQRRNKTVHFETTATGNSLVFLIS